MENDEPIDDLLAAALADDRFTVVDFAEMAKHGYALIPDGYCDRPYGEWNYLVSDMLIWGLTEEQANLVALHFADHRSRLSRDMDGSSDNWSIDVQGLNTQAAQAFMDGFIEWLENPPKPKVQ